MSENSDTSFLSKDDLIDYFFSGCKPKNLFRVGTEHELFVFDQKTITRLSYENSPGILELLKFYQNFGFDSVFENETLIGLKKGQTIISLEPGGQFELSGAPFETIHQTKNELDQHFEILKQAQNELGIFFIALGCDPVTHQNDISWMPKGRYKIMRAYMPQKGKHGLDMMTKTCTAQSNLDFCDEQDMVKKLRTSLAIQPLITALFANSPYLDGNDSNKQSFRSFIWTDTDPDRTGMLDFAFDESMSFERYVDYMLDVPMYFIKRNGRYIDMAGKSFKKFMQGELEGFEKEFPMLSDWIDHTTTAFPEVRLKTYLEMRGADVGTPDMILALSAFWVGLFYDASALDAAYDLVCDFKIDEIKKWRQETLEFGLETLHRNSTIKPLLKTLLELSSQGLKRRAKIDLNGQDESNYLEPLFKITEQGYNHAQQLKNKWGYSFHKENLESLSFL